jgi:hypothetical protein
MKIHIVFEIDTLPEVGLGDVAAIVQLAAQSFNAAVSVLGTSKLHRIKSAPIEPSAPDAKDTAR